MKKILTSLACASLAFGCCVTTIGAVDTSGELNQNEQRLLDYMETGITIDGETFNFAKDSEEYATFKEYLLLPEVNMTEKQVDTIRDSVKEMMAFMEKNADAEEMTPEMFAEFLDILKPATSAFDFTISYDSVKDILIIVDFNGETTKMEGFLASMNEQEPGKDTNKPVDNIKDKVEKKNPNKLENTGENFTSTYVVIGALGTILAAAGYASKKREMI